MSCAPFTSGFSRAIVPWQQPLLTFDRVFCCTAGGEVDVRGCYCALAVCHMLNLDKQALAEACGMVDYVRACQVGREHGSK